MDLLAASCIEIDCPVEPASSYAGDLRNFARWFPGVHSIESGDALDPWTVGKQYRETVVLPLLGPRRLRIELCEAEPGRRLVTQSAFAPLLPRMEIRFQALGERRCRVHWSMWSRSHSLPVRLLLLPLARRLMRRRAALGLARLRQQLAHAGPGAGPIPSAGPQGPR